MKTLKYEKNICLQNSFREISYNQDRVGFVFSPTTEFLQTKNNNFPNLINTIYIQKKAEIGIFTCFTKFEKNICYFSNKHNNNMLLVNSKTIKHIMKIYAIQKFVNICLSSYQHILGHSVKIILQKVSEYMKGNNQSNSFNESDNYTASDTESIESEIESNESETESIESESDYYHKKNKKKKRKKKKRKNK
eukprot:196913_1